MGQEAIGSFSFLLCAWKEHGEAASSLCGCQNIREIGNTSCPGKPLLISRSCPGRATWVMFITTRENILNNIFVCIFFLKYIVAFSGKLLSSSLLPPPSLSPEVMDTIKEISWFQMCSISCSWNWNQCPLHKYLPGMEMPCLRIFRSCFGLKQINQKDLRR